MIAKLDKLPTKTDFFTNYWNKNAFYIKGAIDSKVFEDYVSEDELAYLALDGEIESKFIQKSDQAIENGSNKWQVRYGPFEEDFLTNLPNSHWTLLVQNIDKYHFDTASLYRYFDFAPQWFRDDIMVSYSTPKGTVGPHLDSYHVFLVQGKGERRWKISNKVLVDPKFHKNLPLKILQDDIEGEEVICQIGDILYIPPGFAHDGVSLSNSLTFSLGFLGPTPDEMLISFGEFLYEGKYSEFKRFSGEGFTDKDSDNNISNSSIEKLKYSLKKEIDSVQFDRWLSQYFSNSLFPETESSDLNREEFIEKIKQNGNGLEVVFPIKMARVRSENSSSIIGINSFIFDEDSLQTEILKCLKEESPIPNSLLKPLNYDDENLTVLFTLFENGFLNLVEIK